MDQKLSSMGLVTTSTRPTGKNLVGTHLKGGNSREYRTRHLDQENSQSWSVGCSDGWQKLECRGGRANTECGCQKWFGGSAGAKNGLGEVHVTWKASVLGLFLYNHYYSNNLSNFCNYYIICSLTVFECPPFPSV